MASRATYEGLVPVRKTALHGMLAALPISAAMWFAIVAVVEILR